MFNLWQEEDQASCVALHIYLIKLGHHLGFNSFSHTPVHTYSASEQQQQLLIWKNRQDPQA
jgi:hypothetical protein